ncbi:MAG: DR2241 family protein [Haloarcula sp.]
MDGEYVDALVATAPDGIAFDDLHVANDTDGYTFQTPDVDHSGIDETTLRTVASDSPYVRNWYFWHAVAPQKEDRWAFLRWIEGAQQRGVTERYEVLTDGISSTWGELHLTVTLADGKREYSVRHRADADVGTSALDIHDDPLDAREIAKHDDVGRYRPLKTAPSLQTGWAFPELSASEFVTAVDAFYPATVSNWHREREDELDVTHWRDTVDRQTGIYGVVRTWDRGDGHEHVNWVAEACCDDSQCLKRREWQYDDETHLDVDGGSGAFPCREPCSLVIAGARKWTKLEGEDTQTYEFELTPSEKEQLEAIVDTVADGTVDDIREADIYEGANRYRTRFLRAKLFDDDGNLAGVETNR